MQRFSATFAICALAMLAGCAKQPDQNTYNAQDVGKTGTVDFGTILSERAVEITGHNTHTGALVGGAAGAGAGAYAGGGTGKYWTAGAGALAGAVAGEVAEQAVTDHHGIEYTIKKDNGRTVAIAQNIGKDDVPLKVGQRVMIQKSGKYRRVLPTGLPPEDVKHSKKKANDDDDDQ